MTSRFEAVVALLCLGAWACGRSSLSLNDGEDPKLEPPQGRPCGPGPACSVPEIDPETGDCRRVLAPDGMACYAACLTNAVCIGGRCTGFGPSPCDDGDACTVESCSEELGCSYDEVECPLATSVCGAAVCDPSIGCTTVAVPDGTPCGTNACEATSACRSGECLPTVESPPSRLVAAWNFDEVAGTDVFDGSGNGHHGVLVAGTRTSPPGRIANTGEGLLVDVPDHPDFAFSRSFSVQGFVETSAAAPVGREVIVLHGDAREGLDPFILALQPGPVAQFDVYGPEDGMRATARAPVPTGAFVALTGVFDASTREVRLYVGCEIANTACAGFDRAMSGLDPNSAPGLGLGSHPGLGGAIYQFRGALEAVRLYDGVLDTGEIESPCNP